ncbi:MAG TPA: calcium-binding protein [Solirubrobacterales bacterium]|nr:calcium-binding protein [Solirubrobacterales bacterium]
MNLRRALLTAAVLSLAFFGLSSSASPRGGIILIRGADSGSHLRLTMSGSQLLVNGQTASAERPSGCRLARDYGTSCRLAEASSVIVEMGPSNDKVEVLDPLPVPLTAYMGSGSDKLIGNSEADTCYPQGSPRNRCLGGGGDDICVSGPANTDCVGGPGDDYCKTSSGSDGCWGGPGDDECLMGAGQDGCHGEGGDDRLFGGPGTDRLYGGNGNDDCDGGPGTGQSEECEEGPGR